jgi:glycosyltransferase involved in cell wall biosynthesis
VRATARCVARAHSAVVPFTEAYAAEPPCPPPYTSDASFSPAARPLPLCAPAARAPALPPPGTPPLVHAPDVRTLRSPAVVVLDVRPCAAPPAHAVVVSVHNAAHVLRRNLLALFEHTTGAWELIIVVDACSDGSLEEARAALRDALSSGEGGNGTVILAGVLTRARLVVQPSGVWETSSDNLGLRLAHPAAGVLLLVQADIRVAERGWNARLSLPTRLWSDVWAVSGRNAHNAATGRYETSGAAFNATQFHSMDEPVAGAELAAAGRVFYIRDALNRGPVALRADALRALGFLNERDFHLGRDEHELMLRAYIQSGLKCGKYLVGFAMPARDGASRQKGRKSRRSAHEWGYLVYRLARKRRGEGRAAADALGKLPHWNEERAVSDAQLAEAKAEADKLAAAAQCSA